MRAKMIQSKIPKRVWNCIVPALALIMLGLMIVPAEVWHFPVEDAVYRGFDPNLIYQDEKGYAPCQGIIKAAPESIIFTALPNSHPTIHLITTPLKSFTVSMNVRILQNQPGTIPLRIDVWSARTASGYFLEFGPSPSNVITTRAVVEGNVAQTLIRGKIIKNETLGDYYRGLPYHVKVTLNKEKGTITFSIASLEKSPSGSPIITLIGDPNDPKYGDVISELIPIKEGQEYVFGGWVKLASGSEFAAYKIDIQWLNKDLEHLGVVKNWRSARELQGWTRTEFRVKAPQGASFARILLGCSDASQVLFADLFLVQVGNSDNLIPNGDFRKGVEGWMIVNKPYAIPEVIDPRPVLLESSVTCTEVPELFDSLRISLTVSAASNAGIAVTALENYTLVLPHQRWQVVKVDDYRVRVVVSVLLVIGCILVINKTLLSLQEKILNRAKFNPIQHFLQKMGKLIPLPTPVAMVLGLFVMIFFILNGLLFSLGSLPFDMMAQKIWAYVATNYGFLELYHLPNVVTLAKVWGGVPYHEAVYPYNFGFSYLFTLIGWVYKLFLNGPGPLTLDTYALEFVIKTFNVLFVLADGLLIYLILKELKTGKNQRILACIIFIFNPVVLFIASIWGQTYLISVFFMLASIWCAEKHRPQWAWLMLAIGALNRPQMLIPLFLLGLIYIKKFPIRDNIQSISWSVILVFLLLGPFSLTISPSMPLDILRNQLFVQEAGGNEPELMLVSLDAYNLWPVLTYIQGSRGLGCIYFSSTSPLIDGLSYLRVSQILTLGFLLCISWLLLFRNKLNMEPSYYILLLTLGTIGFLLLKTGVAVAHFVIALPLLILCRQYMRDAAWFSIIFAWTITMLIPLCGSLGFAIENVEYLAPALHSTNNAIMRFFMYLHSSDWFIILGCSTNLVILACLTVKTVTTLRFTYHRK